MLHVSMSALLEDSLDFWLAAVLVHAPDARLIIVGSHESWYDGRLYRQ